MATTPDRPTLARALPLLLCLSLAAPSARGDDEAAARALYQEGHKLVAAGQVAKGCTKFEESLKLKENANARFFLGDCYEKVGRTASAWTAFLSAATKAKAAGDVDKVEQAKARADSLEPKLSRLSIKVVAEAKGLVVKRGETEVGRGQWESAIPVDPGAILVTASAPGKKAWSRSIDVSGTTPIELVVPALEDEPSSSTGGGDSAAGSSGGTARTLGLVVGGVGVVALGASVFLGLSAKSRWNESNDAGRCVDDRCTPEGLSIRSDARSKGNVASIVAGVGAAALVTGGVLFFTAKGEAAPSSGFLRSMRVGLGPSSFVLDARF